MNCPATRAICGGHIILASEARGLKGLGCLRSFAKASNLNIRKGGCALLAEAIVRIGRPLARSSMTIKDRIRWLTDVDSESCKNYFQHVWVVELGPDEHHDALHFMQIGEMKGVGKKAEFNVDTRRNVAFPFHFPNGGNPLNAQGVYPLPCYLLWDPHIKSMKDTEEFAVDVLLPRLLKTVPYIQEKETTLRQLAQRVASRLAANCSKWLKEDKQLGILMIFDPNLACFRYADASAEIRIQESGVRRGQWMALDGSKVLEWIRESKVREATELGESKDEISTFTNQKSERVVSLYNKSWLWMSPTWDLPKSIYWKDDEWIKGIKVDPETYEYFYYGTQFMKAIQVPISSAILKEMFAPVMHAEARQKIKATSYEQIYGIPMLLPLLDGDSEQQFRKYRLMLRPDENMSRSVLHLRLLAGLDLLVPESDDDYRLDHPLLFRRSFARQYAHPGDDRGRHSQRGAARAGHSGRIARHRAPGSQEGIGLAQRIRPFFPGKLACHAGQCLRTGVRVGHDAKSAASPADSPGSPSRVHGAKMQRQRKTAGLASCQARTVVLLGFPGICREIRISNPERGKGV